MASTDKAGRAVRRAARRLRRGAAPAAGTGPADPPPRTAILIVNGFDRKGRWGDFNEQEARDFPWIDLCLRQIERHSATSSFEVLVWDNSFIPEHRRLLQVHPRVRMFGQQERGQHIGHGAGLNKLLWKVRQGTEFVITLDTDSFPVRDGWIENLTGRLTAGAMIAGAWRAEVDKPTYVHPCGLAIRRDTLWRLGTGFQIREGVDVGTNLNAAVAAVGGTSSKLRRSNAWDPHPLMGAVYGDLIYHQGAGSRGPKFAGAGPAADHEAMREALRDAAFTDLDGLVAALTGDAPPETVPAVLEASRR